MDKLRKLSPDSSITSSPSYNNITHYSKWRSSAVDTWTADEAAIDLQLREISATFKLATPDNADTTRNAGGTTHDQDAYDRLKSTLTAARLWPEFNDLPPAEPVDVHHPVRCTKPTTLSASDYGGHTFIASNATTEHFHGSKVQGVLSGMMPGAAMYVWNSALELCSGKKEDCDALQAALLEAHASSLPVADLPELLDVYKRLWSAHSPLPVNLRPKSN